MKSKIKSEIMEQLTRNQMLGEDYIIIDGLKIKLQNNNLTCFDLDLCELNLINNLSCYDIENLINFVCPDEFKTKFYVLELDYLNLPFEYFDKVNIFKNLKDLKERLCDSLFILVIRNANEYHNDFCIDTLFDIVYLPDTEYIFNSFNYNVFTNQVFILPRLEFIHNSFRHSSSLGLTKLLLYSPSYGFKYNDLNILLEDSESIVNNILDLKESLC